MNNNRTKIGILDKVAKEYKQEDWDYALRNCLPSYLHIIAKQAMQEYANQMVAEKDKRISELENRIEELIIDHVDIIDSRDVIIHEQTDRIKELEAEIYRLQFSI